MKQLFLFAAAATITFAACNEAPKADKAATTDEKAVAGTEGVPYQLDSTQTVHFIGTKPVGQHSGSFNISSGELFVKNNTELSGGKFTINIHSLKITDADTAGSYKLVGHLSSADFFDVANNPTASFEITSVTPYKADSAQALVLNGATNTVNGNLTLKGVTKNVSFPAIITISADSVSAKANFNINRTDWGLVYGNDKSLGDKFIRPEVNISFDIKAVKK